MRIRITLLLSFFLLLLGLNPALAQDVKEPATGVSFPSKTNANGRDFTITGTGVRKKFGFKVYAMASYLETGKLDSSKDIYGQLTSDGASKMIIMHFVRDVDAGKIKETFEEGIKKNLPNYESSPAKKDAETFLNVLTELKNNDKMQLNWYPGGEVHLSIKGQGKFAFKNSALASAIWSIWFGRSPIAGDLKTSLVANAK
ncbi:MAG: chalcone isomerase family protein [Blastocatellia bacterium]|nr:chalcone isomerase family protein [Blastocatellia bacterium]